MRKLLVLLHRWAGLFRAVFLAVAGLTGSVIAWEHGLDRWLNPGFHYAAPSDAPLLPATEVARRVEAAHPQLQVSFMLLAAAPDQTLVMMVAPRRAPATGQPYVLGFDQMAVQPATAEVQGTRTWGQASLVRENVVPFLYKLHHTLYLPRAWGWTGPCGSWARWPCSGWWTASSRCGWPFRAGVPGANRWFFAGRAARAPSTSTCTAPAAYGPGC